MDLCSRFVADAVAAGDWSEGQRLHQKIVFLARCARMNHFTGSLNLEVFGQNHGLKTIYIDT